MHVCIFLFAGFTLLDLDIRSGGDRNLQDLPGVLEHAVGGPVPREPLQLQLLPAAHQTHQRNATQEAAL